MYLIFLFKENLKNYIVSIKGLLNLSDCKLLYSDRYTSRRECSIPDFLNQNKPSLLILPKGGILKINDKPSKCILLRF